MREGFAADWAFSICGVLENIVRENFPEYLRQWPLLQSFDFDAYEINGEYACIILKDKLSGITSGPGIPKPFPYSDLPLIPPRVEDVETWQNYLRTKFKLRNEDAAFLIPIHESGKNAPADYELFDVSEQKFWDTQIKYNVSRYKAYLTLVQKAPQPQPVNITYNVSGQNTRVNINSKDSSTNIVDRSYMVVFSQLMEAAETIQDSNKKEEIKKSIRDMEESCGTDTFAGRYKEFMSVTANHITVFAPLLATLASFL